MHKSSIVYFLFAISLSALSSCATNTRGKTDTLVVNSTPSGAFVEVSNGLQGKTPASFKLPRSFEGIVTIRREGYETVEVNLTPQVSWGGRAGMVGNLFLGGIIGAGGILGAGVDVSTGAMDDLVPNPIEVFLVPLGGPAAAVKEENSSSVESRLLELKKLLSDGLITQEEYDAKRTLVIDSIQ